MGFGLDKITDLEFVRESCRCIIFVRPLSIEADNFPCKGISDCFQVQGDQICVMYLIIGESNFWSGVRGSLPKRRKKGLSLEWIP